MQEVAVARGGKVRVGESVVTGSKAEKRSARQKNRTKLLEFSEAPSPKSAVHVDEDDEPHNWRYLKQSRSFNSWDLPTAREDMASLKAPEQVDTSEAEITKDRGEECTGLNRYLRDIGQYKLLTPEVEQQLAKEVQRGCLDAIETLVKANLRLVVKIARDYEGLGLPLLDLISEGNIGLDTAAKRFEPGKAKFSTYASWWIKSMMRRALANQSRTIRHSVHFVEKLCKLYRGEQALFNRLGRMPTLGELSREIKMSPERIQAIRGAEVQVVSLEAPISCVNWSDPLRVEDIVADASIELPADEISRREVKAHAMLAMNSLDPREREIITLRFRRERELTLEQVGQRLGYTRERIRQLQNIALNKMRECIERM